jgi:alkylation response protein AidB-like acyl-CoA dehydrogenase
VSGSTFADAAVIDVAARLDAVAPGAFAALAGRPLAEHEQDAAPALAALKSTRATTMLVPAMCGGRGASATAAVRFQTAIGALAPSAAIATTMHHYKIAALGNVARAGDEHAGAILAELADGAKLMASGGAESTPGRDLRSLGSVARRDGDGYLVSAVKRPCSLSMSMDILSLMVELQGPDGTPEGFAQAFVPADADGLRCEPFWQSPAFHAAQSHAVHLEDVRIGVDRVFPLDGSVGVRFASDCYAYFSILLSAAYLGVACCVAGAAPPAERATAQQWQAAVDRIRELEAVVLEAARAADDGRPAGEVLNLAVHARDVLQDELGCLGGRLMQAAGGGTFARTGSYTMLAGALNAVAFHPPQRGRREGTGLEALSPELRERG